MQNIREKFNKNKSKLSSIHIGICAESEAISKEYIATMTCCFFIGMIPLVRSFIHRTIFSLHVMSFVVKETNLSKQQQLFCYFSYRLHESPSLYTYTHTE